MASYLIGAEHEEQGHDDDNHLPVDLTHDDQNPQSLGDVGQASPD